MVSSKQPNARFTVLPTRLRSAWALTHTYHNLIMPC